MGVVVAADAAAADRGRPVDLRLIEPHWPRHPRIRACVTTRQGGVSRGAFSSLNLADHVGDDPADVAKNRHLLRMRLGLEHEPGWLAQVHGIDVVRLERADAGTVSRADAAWTDRPGLACAILTADCLPVLLADDDGTCVAAAHAGWRGLCAGVLERTVARLPVASRSLTAWLGPAIGAEAFEVGQEVVDAFAAIDSGATFAFREGRAGRYLGDLHLLARRRLAAAGVTRVYGDATQCTVRDADVYFSYRRDRTCGRMATLVWIDSMPTQDTG